MGGGVSLIDGHIDEVKKPIVCGYREDRLINSISYVCPSCHNHISIDNFCENCGQALDWSDTE